MFFVSPADETGNLHPSKNYDRLMSSTAPLAERMRPRSLDEVIGQDIAAEGSALRQALASGRPHSMIFWGPPGTGKTTIAKALASEVDADFEQLSAVTSGIKDLRAVIARADERREAGRRTLLFIDEIHRWNKSQQDALLPHVESGEIILAGATTENPGVEVNRALMSRSKLYRLEALDDAAVEDLVRAALSDERGLTGETEPYRLSQEAMNLLLLHANGDARAALNGLEAASSLRSEGGEIGIAEMEAGLGRRQPAYDKNGDEHYDTVSAFIKSIRGGDVDASLYYLARMEAGGEDPKFIARRLVISASEDIGLARPGALAIATAGYDAVTQIGPPECFINLAEVTAYLASCPKSWASYKGLNRARELVRDHPHYPIPAQLRNPSNKLTQGLGYGKGYVHASAGKAAEAVEFLPDELKGARIYRPDEDTAV